MAVNVPRCRDFDEDCDDVPDHLHCWLYDPAKGYCPFLRKEGPVPATLYFANGGSISFTGDDEEGGFSSLLDRDVGRDAP